MKEVEITLVVMGDVKIHIHGVVHHIISIVN